MKYANLGLWKIKFFTTIFVLFTACPVFAIGFGDIGGLLGGGGPDLSGKQTELTGSLRSALINLTQSQILMAKAGYDPSEASRVWERMAKASGGKEPPEWMSTHPANNKRRDKLTDWLDETKDIYNKSKVKYGLGESI